MPRRNRKIQVGEEFRIAVRLSLKKFCYSEDEKEYSFPSSLTANERAYVHKYCLELGLKSKSRGQGANRFLTVYKKEGSTIVQADAIFELGNSSQRYTLRLLQSYPVTSRERQELLPPTGRDRMFGHEAIRDVNRSIGRLIGGIPMVPPCRCENEFTPFRQNLPIYNSREEIIQMISCHQTVLISGETGSGKTTQVPQYILEHHSDIKQPCRIICTEPRRIAATTIAERVALERGEKLGQTVGYQIRLDSRLSPKTLLTFCTTGVLLRTLMGGDASIATVTHIIVDELHERDRLSDFLLIVIRDLLLKFRNLKIVLMSASLDTQLFSRYFSNCPIIEVPGRVFDVKAFFLEDILKGTGYTNASMSRYKVEFSQKSHKLDSWCSVQVPNSTIQAKTSISNNLSIAANQISDSYIQQHLNFDDLSINSTIGEPVERVELEPTLAAAMDEVMENLWLSGSDDFSGLLQLLLIEKISVDYQHSETGVSSLMLAAGRGNLEAIEQLLALGASLHLKSSNGWTAIDWAKNFEHKEIEELLAGQWVNEAEVKDEENQCDYDYEPPDPENVDQTSINADDKLILDAYLHSIDEDKIDYELIVCLLNRICLSQDDGAVLIFLPGYDDIIGLREKISSTDMLSARVLVMMLHSQIQSSEQRRVFRPAPEGYRKVVLATNIAETSITINDVVFVIDCGKVKEKTYDAITGSSQLKPNWISKASAIQRRGRAGRCRPGLSYHMYSKARFNSFQKFQVPEILRVPIHELCLQAKLLAPPNAPIADFLAKAPDPPPFMVTRNAVTLLKTIDALDPWEELTELGLHLLDLPIEPRLGKMILYSVVLKCLDPVLTIVCSLSYRDPFILPTQPSQRRAVHQIKRQFSLDTFSDHMILLQAFQGWQRARGNNNDYHYCKRHFLSHAVLDMIAAMRTQLLSQLKASGFLRGLGYKDMRELNVNSDSWAVVKAALCAGTYPNLIRIDRDRQQLITQKESKVLFHNSSVLSSITMGAKQYVPALRKKALSDIPSDWLIYEEMMRTGSTAHAHCCTIVSPITIALFAGPAKLPLDALHEPNQDNINDEEDSGDETKYDNQHSLFKIDDWIAFRVEPEMARLVLQLRQKWHALFLRRMHSPSKPLSVADEAVIQTISGVLVSEDVALNLLQPSGINHRSQPIDHFSPSKTRKNYQNSMYWDPNDVHKDYSYFNSNNVFESNVPSSGASNYTSFTNNSAQNSINHAFNNQQLINPEMNFSSASAPNYYRVAYFIVKATTSRIVEVSMSENIWAFTPITERKVMTAVNEGKDVILIFSIQGSGHFQGFARFTPQLADFCPPEFSASCFGPCYTIEWLRKAYLPFQSTRHLQNAWNENRKVQVSKDGQELEPTVGEELCRLLFKAHSAFSMECMNEDNRRQINYIQENFHNEPALTDRNQMQFDVYNSKPSFFGPSGKYWSPRNS